MNTFEPSRSNPKRDRSPPFSGRLQTAMLAGLSFALLKGDGCGQPEYHYECSAQIAAVEVVPGQCTPIPSSCVRNDFSFPGPVPCHCTSPAGRPADREIAQTWTTPSWANLGVEQGVYAVCLDADVFDRGIAPGHTVALEAKIEGEPPIHIGLKVVDDQWNVALRPVDGHLRVSAALEDLKLEAIVSGAPGGDVRHAFEPQLQATYPECFALNRTNCRLLDFPRADLPAGQCERALEPGFNRFTPDTVRISECGEAVGGVRAPVAGCSRYAAQRGCYVFSVESTGPGAVKRTARIAAEFVSGTVARIDVAPGVFHYESENAVLDARNSAAPSGALYTWNVRRTPNGSPPDTNCPCETGCSGTDLDTCRIPKNLMVSGRYDAELTISPAGMSPDTVRLSLRVD